MYIIKLIENFVKLFSYFAQCTTRRYFADDLADRVLADSSSPLDVLVPEDRLAMLAHLGTLPRRKQPEEADLLSATPVNSG